MKTIKIKEEAWKILNIWKLELKSKTLSDAIIDQNNLHKAALNYIGVLSNDKSKK